MIRIATIHTQDAAAAEFIGQWCTEDDHELAKSRRSEHSRTNFLCARALVRQLLYVVTAGKPWSLQYDIQGKPFALDAQGNSGPHITISHTSGMASAAICTSAALGVDIEFKRARNFPALAAYAFGPEEIKAVEARGADAFYRIWTLREAMSKATGSNLLDSFTGKDCVPEFAECRFHAQGQELFYYDLEAYSLALACLSTANEKLDLDLVHH